MRTKVEQSKNYIKVNEKRLRDLCECEAYYFALQEAGVDNWDGADMIDWDGVDERKEEAFEKLVDESETQK